MIAALLGQLCMTLILGGLLVFIMLCIASRVEQMTELGECRQCGALTKNMDLCDDCYRELGGSD